METRVPPADASRAARWTGRGLGGAAVLLLLFSGGIKVLALEPARASSVQLGYPVEITAWLGLLELGLTGLYLWPRTALVGAILLTGYLGGAVATHLRLLDPWLSHTLFPVWVGAFLWGGLLLRAPGLRAALLRGSVTAR